MIIISWVIDSTRTLPEGGDEIENIYQDLLIDGSITETYNVSATITTYPIEIGVDVTESTRPNLSTIDLECKVSNNPTNPLIVALNDDDRVGTVLAQLDEFITNGIDIDLQTDRGFFERYLIKSRSETRDLNTGDGAIFTLSFQQLRIAEVQEVDAPAPRVERTRSRQTRGRQAAQSSSDTNPVSTSPDSTTRDGVTQRVRSILRRELT